MRATLLIAAGALLLGAVLGYAQSSFPMRFDEPEVAPLVGAIDAVVAGGLQLKPLDAPPVTCDVAHAGYMYMQNDVGSDVPTWSVQLCVCAILDDGVTGFWWNAQTNCADLASP